MTVWLFCKETTAQNPETVRTTNEKVKRSCTQTFTLTRLEQQASDLEKES